MSQKRFIVSYFNSYYDSVDYTFPTKKEALKKYNELIKPKLYADNSSVTLFCEEILASTDWTLEEF